MHKYDDFTYENLEKELIKAKAKFRFCGFDENIDDIGCVLLRHDIDFSMDKALEMAIFQSKLGIKATYYFLLRSDNYNIFSEKTNKEIRKIQHLGHDIGLHFDHAFYGKIHDENQLIKLLSFEKEIFENELKIRLKSFAYHNTTPDILRFNCLKYANLINVYNERYFKKIRYCSDSYGVWRFNSMYDELKINKTIQILLHPALWSENSMPPPNRIKESFSKRFELSFNNYLEFVKANFPQILNND
jgi:hypothetical protein